MVSKISPMDCFADRAHYSAGSDHQIGWRSPNRSRLGKIGDVTVLIDADYGDQWVLFILAPLHCQGPAKEEDGVLRICCKEESK
jgi:hypothetical protein